MLADVDSALVPLHVGCVIVLALVAQWLTRACSDPIKPASGHASLWGSCQNATERECRGATGGGWLPLLFNKKQSGSIYLKKIYTLLVLCTSTSISMYTHYIHTCRKARESLLETPGLESRLTPSFNHQASSTPKHQELGPGYIIFTVFDFLLSRLRQSDLKKYDIKGP